MDSLQELLPSWEQSRSKSTRRVGDTQKHKLYAAEKEAFRNLPEVDRTVEEVSDFYKKILAHKYIQTHYPNARYEINVISTRGTFARRGWSEISIAPWARKKEWVQIHELAHVLDDGAWTDKRDHGRRFAYIYVDLVRHILGKEWSDLLKKSFRAHGVRFNEPKKRTVNVDPQVRVDALAKGRAVRQAKADLKYVLVRDDGKFCKSTAAYRTA